MTSNSWWYWGPFLIVFIATQIVWITFYHLTKNAIRQGQTHRSIEENTMPTKVWVTSVIISLIPYVNAVASIFVILGVINLVWEYLMEPSPYGNDPEKKKSFTHRMAERSVNREKKNGSTEA